MLIVKYIDFNFFLAYNKDAEKEGEIKMDTAFLKLGIALFIAIVGVYICFNVIKITFISDTSNREFPFCHLTQLVTLCK